jgi:antitoxin VapB
MKTIKDHADGEEEGPLRADWRDITRRNKSWDILIAEGYPMALFIKNPVVEKSARKLARLTGETLTEATLRAIEERLTRIQPERSTRSISSQLEKDLLRIAHQCAALPDLDARTADEILGYDSEGLPS